MAELVFRHLSISGLDFGFDAFRTRFDILNPCASEDVDPLLRERFLEECGNFSILNRHNPIEHLNHGHIRAHIVVEAGKLDPDSARADDEKFARHFRRCHRRAVCPDAFSVSGRKGQIARTRACRDNNMLG